VNRDGTSQRLTKQDSSTTSSRTRGVLGDVTTNAVEGETEPLTQRARKRNERRDRVFAAAIELFAERGYDETSMDDIAARAGLARTTVFNHYPRKVLFLEDWTHRRRRRAARSFADRAPHSASLRTVLGAYLGGLAALNEDNRAEAVAIMPLALRYTDVMVDHPLGRELAELVTEARAELRPGTEPPWVGRLLALGYFSAVSRWIATEPPPFGLADELTRLLDAVLLGALWR
jgi:AcrR family transcriptional regulator